ncbi:C45 family autoproteolytic acyltransferase/hydolase [Taklimakanibacter deserti]|uniref:C45 family autoproteolytic acyltransferase/hydolase n=1 Tax=Taklimakanibacter deserti TaxID=2267839 RepID=UPI0034D6949C
MKAIRLAAVAVMLLFACVANVAIAAEELTGEEKGWLAKSSRSEENGWIRVKIGGAPFERGFQHGYLLAAEFKDAWRVYDAMTLQTTGLDLAFFVTKAADMHRSKIPVEQLDEMRGIAAGFTKAGVPTTLDQIIGWNAWMEMTGYWWPTVAGQYKNAAPGAVGMNKAKSHCSAFIATGSATADGKIVIGHESFTEFWNGQYFNVIVDITPDKGYRMVMQTSPGWIGSMTDFWVTGGGLVVVETTLVGFVGYDTSKVPEYVRARTASQYASSIDEWVKLVEAQNNGGYANAWLIGDIKSNQIAKYEQGLIYQNLEKKKDGWFFGANVPDDPRIRNLESSDVGYNDIRQQTGARRMRWPQLLSQHEGRIDAAIGQAMLGDTFDVYLMRIEPSSRTISSHYDTDPQPYVSDPNAVWNVPYYPAGSVDGKVTTADAARSMSMWGRFGRADGLAFDADEFLRIHPQWNWQQGYLKSRPSEPWTYFDGAK